MHTTVHCVCVCVLYVSSCSDQVWRSCWEICWCCLSPVDAEPVSSVFSGLFFFFLLSFFVSSKPVTFLFLRILPIFSLLCTTWNFAKFHTFLSVFLSLHSCCPLIGSDEALWRNVIFSIKKKNLKNQNLDLRCCAANCCMEKLWRSRWKTVLKLPLSDAKPVSSSLPFTSQAARIEYGAPAGKSADAAFLRSTLNPSLPSFLACFFSFCFPFLSLPNLSPSSSFEFFRSFPFSVLLGTLPSSIPSFLYFYQSMRTVGKMCLDLAIGVLRALFEKAPVRQGRFGAKFAKRQLFFDTQIFLFRIQKVIFGIHTAVRQGFNVGFCQSKCSVVFSFGVFF